MIIAGVPIPDWIRIETEPSGKFRLVVHGPGGKYGLCVRATDGVDRVRRVVDHLARQHDVALAVIAEREACARVAGAAMRDYALSDNRCGYRAAEAIAEAIQARNAGAGQ